MPERFTLGYRPALDGMRALAVLLVMWHHTVAFLLPSLAERDLGAGGFIGVDLFFVLSGFLITSLIAERRRSGRFTFADFYRRRAARLLPALAVFLAVHATLIGLLDLSAAAELRTVLAAATFTSNWAPVFDIELVPDLVHLWSLAIEEQFYLVWPAGLLALLLLRRRPLMFGALAAAIAAIAVWRIVLLDHYGTGYPIVYQRTDSRADALLVGATLALALHFGWRPSATLRQITGWAGIATTLAYTVWGNAGMDFVYLGGFTLIALGAAGIILTGLEGPGVLYRLLAWAPAVALGRASYSLYLWHVVVIELVARFLDGPLVFRIAVAWAGSIAVAALSRRFVELPFIDLAHRRRGRPRRPLHAPS